jgi:hypothetical protein
MWDESKPVLSKWPSGRIEPEEILFEFEGPAAFTAFVGLARFFFFKFDEGDTGDLFLGTPIADGELRALKEGRISVRGVFSQETVWLIEALPNLSVRKFQEQRYNRAARLLPPNGVALPSGKGEVPDTLEQAEALLAFKFVGQNMTTEAMPLGIFKGIIDNIHELIRKNMTPVQLKQGRDNRFFDVKMGEPKFASLLLSIRTPDFDEDGLRENRRTKNLSPELLREDALERSEELWQSIRATAETAKQRELTSEEIVRYRELLDQLVEILPSTSNDLESLEVSFRGNQGTSRVSINRESGERLVRAQQSSRFHRKTLVGTIVEVNGESFTFILKEPNDRVTTCAIPWKTFEDLDARGLMKRGARIKIVGDYNPRTYRGYLWSESPPEFLSR